MIGFIILLVTVTALAITWTVWKYRRDIILGAIAWIAFKIIERRIDK